MTPKPETKLSIDQESLRWSSRTIAKIEILLLILVLLSLGFVGVDSDDRAAIGAGLLVYTAVVLNLRYITRYRGQTRWVMAAETWAMVPFITWSIWFTDKLASPLRNAYLLVIVTSALTVGMRTTMYQLGLIAVGIVLAGEIWSAEVLFSFGYLSGLVTRLTPLIIVAYLTSIFASDIRYAMCKAGLPAEIDEITKLYNTRGFAIVANRLFGQTARHNNPASVLVIAIDDFNAIGDAHGDEAGKAVLRATANRIRTELRHNDVLARCRDDRFVALLPETAARSALDVAERIRRAVAAATITFEEKPMPATVSIGHASCDGAGRSIDALLAEAEHAMHAGNEPGHNGIVVLAP